MAEGSFKLGFEGCLGIHQLDRNKDSPGRKNSLTIKGRRGMLADCVWLEHRGYGGGREVQDEGTGKDPLVLSPDPQTFMIGTRACCKGRSS